MAEGWMEKNKLGISLSKLDQLLASTEEVPEFTILQLLKIKTQVLLRVISDRTTSVLGKSQGTLFLTIIKIVVVHVDLFLSTCQMQLASLAGT